MNISSQKIGERAGRITTLQRGFTSAQDEEEITRLLLATKGKALTELKQQIDHGPGHYDLLELVYHDIDDRQRRARILNHFAAHSPIVPEEEKKVRLISDIDDTLYASLNDPAYVRGTLYPGITAFHEEVAKQSYHLRGRQRPGRLEIGRDANGRVQGTHPRGTDS